LPHRLPLVLTADSMMGVRHESAMNSAMDGKVLKTRIPCGQGKLGAFDYDGNVGRQVLLGAVLFCGGNALGVPHHGVNLRASEKVRAQGIIRDALRQFLDDPCRLSKDGAGLHKIAECLVQRP
jgi:hypothetical protein